jgi:iron complex outermembrane recepter protein
LLYAKYARGYRQGGLKPEGYSLAAFAPEKIDSYEVGFKTTWRGAIRGTFNVSAFYNDFSNQQISTSGVFSTAGLPAGITLTPAQLITNIGKSRIAGVEVDASLSPFQGLQIDMGYAYLDTKVREIATLAAQGPFTSFIPGGARVDMPLTFVPKNKVTITGTYTLPLDESVGKISIGGTFTHVDAQQASYQAYDCQFGTVGNLGTGGCNRRGVLGYDIGRLPALNLVNLNINWTSVAGSPVDLAVFVTNLTKQRYYTATFGGYTSFGLEGGSVGEPRMIGARLKYRLGS